MLFENTKKYFSPFRIIISDKAILSYIVISAGFICLYGFDHYSLWDDEARTYMTSRANSLINVLKAIFIFIPDNPPLDPLVRHFFMFLFGENAFSFTIPSVFFSLLGIAATYFLAKYLFDAPTALLASFLLSIHPLFITYAQEGRNYAILIPLTTISTLFFVYALDLNSKKIWCLYTLSLTFSFYSHYITSCIAISHFLYLIFFLYTKKLRKTYIVNYSLSGLASIMLFSPWLFLFLEKYNFNPLGRTDSSAWFSRANYSFEMVISKFMYDSDFYLSIGILLIALPVFVFIKSKHKIIMPLIIASTYFLSYFSTKNLFFHIRYIYYDLPLFIILLAAIIINLLTYLGKLIHIKSNNYFLLILFILIFMLNIEKTESNYSDGALVDVASRETMKYINAEFRDGDLILIPETSNSSYFAYTKLPLTGYLLTNDCDNGTEFKYDERYMELLGLSYQRLRCDLLRWSPEQKKYLQKYKRIFFVYTQQDIEKSKVYGPYKNLPYSEQFKMIMKRDIWEAKKENRAMWGIEKEISFKELHPKIDTTVEVIIFSKLAI